MEWRGMNCPTLAPDNGLPGAREFDAPFSFPPPPMDFRRARLQFQIGKVWDWTNATLAYRMVCSGIMRGTQDFRKHDRLFSSPCRTLPIVLCGPDLQGGEHPKPCW